LLTFWFQRELAQKASQKAVQQVRYYDRSTAENASPRPAHDAGSRVGIWNILKKQVTSG